MWINGNYRRIFLDAHIDDWNEEFLSKVDPELIVSTIKQSGAQNIVVKAKPHTGLCYWPSSVGRMHKGLKGRDYVGEMIELCHQNDIAVMVYYSQIFDNWAYDHHPAWRCVFADGLNSKEKSRSFLKKGRYGVVCPNNQEYRAYVKENLEDLNHKYQFEGMFLDMPFWPDVCYCSSCKEKFYAETGKEMPKVVNWDDPTWVEFQAARERWMGEFTAFSTRCVKDIHPEVTIEHNFAAALTSWEWADTDLIMDACDYAGGDLYGGYLQQTFCCKYYKNVSKNLPFVFIASRCDPNLAYHTTTKTNEELLLHAITALAHNGAFSLCDGMNPDGTITPEVYLTVMKEVFDETRKYEKYVSGDMLSNVSIWVPTFSKFKRSSSGQEVTHLTLGSEDYLQGQIKMASILRENNIPFDVISSRNLPGLKDDILVLSDVAQIRDDEMQAIESYILNGGNLYVSGYLGHPRLRELMEVDYLGTTEHTFTYMNPTEKGKELLEGFSTVNPLTVEEAQQIVKVKGDCEILATITLPYTLAGSDQFAAIHSNPPGIHTDMPAILLKQVGRGKIMWIAAPIEKSKPYMTRRAVFNLVKSLNHQEKFSSNAPSFVEILGWNKDGKLYFAAINQQETSPVAPIYDVFIDVPGEIKQVCLLETTETVTTEYDGQKTRIKLPKLELFHMVEVVL